MIFFPLKKTFIVAEIGNNHEGSIKTAKRLILAAKKTGVDAVKFQTYDVAKYVNTDDKKRYKILKKFQLKKAEFVQLANFAKKNGLKFISTPFDLESANFLNEIVDYFKISSGDNNFHDLISLVVSKKKPTLISTGLLNLKQIGQLIRFVKSKIPRNKICFLHCISSYPVEVEEANLFIIDRLIKKFKVNVGYSDHTIGDLASIASVVLGAKVIEKHFTLDNNFSNFRDHRISLNPKDMKKLVKSIRDVEKMCTKKKDKISNGEKTNLKSMRRSIYAKNDLKKKSINI